MSSSSLQKLCVRHFAKLVFQSYSSKNKNKVYYQIWHHAGKPNTPRFGETQVFNVDWSIFLRSVADAGFDLAAGVKLFLQDQNLDPKIVNHCSELVEEDGRSLIEEKELGLERVLV